MAACGEEVDLSVAIEREGKGGKGGEGEGCLFCWIGILTGGFLVPGFVLWCV